MAGTDCRNAEIVGSPLNSTPIGIALPKGADALTTQVNEALARINANGTHKAIYAKWLGVSQN